jgi:hypothetical protein
VCVQNGRSEVVRITAADGVRQSATATLGVTIAGGPSSAAAIAAMGSDVLRQEHGWEPAE